MLHSKPCSFNPHVGMLASCWASARAEPCAALGTAEVGPKRDVLDCYSNAGEDHRFWCVVFCPLVSDHIAETVKQTPLVIEP
jgi:hypothetical protein